MKKIIILFPLLLLSEAINIDNLFLEKKALLLDISFSYTNISYNDSIKTPFDSPMQDNELIYLENTINQDDLESTLMFRYGFLQNIELFSSINFFITNKHISINNIFYTETDRRFDSMNIGFIYKIKKENKTPSLYFGTNTIAIEKLNFLDQNKNNYFKNFTFFLNSFYSMDPIVFFLRISYEFSLKQKVGNYIIKNGKKITFSPQIYFLINPYITLNWGIRYNYYDKDQINNRYITSSGSNINYIFGVNYEINNYVVLSIDTEYTSNILFTQNNISCSISYKF